MMHALYQVKVSGIKYQAEKCAYGTRMVDLDVSVCMCKSICHVCLCVCVCVTVCVCINVSVLYTCIVCSYSSML